MSATLEDQICAAKLLLVQRQHGVDSAIKANETISKIPAKSSGGGKCRKKEVLQAVEDTRAAQAEATKSLASLEVLFQTQTRDAMAKTDNQTGTADAASAPAGSDSISQSAGPEEANTEGDSSAATELAITPVAQVGVPASGDIIMDDNANPTETETQEKDQTGFGENLTAPGVIMDENVIMDNNANPTETETQEKDQTGSGENLTAPGAAPPVQSSGMPKRKKRVKASKAPEAADGVKDSSAKKAKVDGTRKAPVNKDIDSGTPSVVAYQQLDEEGKEIVQEKGLAAVTEYLIKDKPIPFEFWHLIREVQEFLPLTATISRKLSLHILSTNCENIICLFHQHHRYAKFNDGFANEKHILIGVPYASLVTSTKEGQQASAEGHLHCGCNINVALLDFFWWKTWVLKSMRPGLVYSEGMGDEVIQTCVRAFFAQAFTEATGLTIEDLYRSNVGAHGYNSKEMWMFQLLKMLHLVNEFNEMDRSPLLALGIANPNHEK